MQNSSDRSVGNVALNFPHESFAFMEHEAFGVMSQLELGVGETVDPELVSGFFYFLQHPQLVCAASRVVLDDLLFVHKFLLVYVQIQPIYVALYYVNLACLV